MTNEDLAHSYLRKSIVRLEVLDLFLKKQDYSDVIREAQEIVELCLKGMLRYVSIEPPNFMTSDPFCLNITSVSKELPPEI